MGVKGKPVVYTGPPRTGTLALTIKVNSGVFSGWGSETLGLGLASPCSMHQLRDLEEALLLGLSL